MGKLPFTFLSNKNHLFLEFFDLMQKIVDAFFVCFSFLINQGGSFRTVTFDYSTGVGPKCSALLFLNANQTADKKGPYLYSQCQAIHARSLIPLQDSPSVKQTYHAKVCQFLTQS